MLQNDQYLQQMVALGRQSCVPLEKPGMFEQEFPGFWDGPEVHPRGNITSARDGRGEKHRSIDPSRGDVGNTRHISSIRATVFEINARLYRASNVEHAVEDVQEIPNTRGMGHFLGFAGNQHPWVKRADYRIVSAGDQSPHIEDLAHSRSAVLQGAVSPHGSTAPIDGSQADRGSCLLPVEHAQFRQVRQERQRKSLATQGPTVAGRLFPPQRTSVQRPLWAVVQVLEFLLQPGRCGPECWDVSKA